MDSCDSRSRNTYNDGQIFNIRYVCLKPFILVNAINCRF